MRLGAAQELLAVTDLSAGEIALALGYANQPAFSHAFHRWCGMPPQQRRKEWMSGQARQLDAEGPGLLWPGLRVAAAAASAADVALQLSRLFPAVERALCGGRRPHLDVPHALTRE